MNGLFRTESLTDIDIFRYGVMGMLNKGERVDADNGYRRESMHIDVHIDCAVTGSSEEVAVICMHKAVVRACHETIDCRFK